MFQGGEKCSNNQQSPLISKKEQISKSNNNVPRKDDHEHEHYTRSKKDISQPDTYKFDNNDNSDKNPQNPINVQKSQKTLIMPTNLTSTPNNIYMTSDGSSTNILENQKFITSTNQKSNIKK